MANGRTEEVATGRNTCWRCDGYGFLDCPECHGLRLDGRTRPRCLGAGDSKSDGGKDEAAQALGRKGGRARADSLNKKSRSEIAKKAAKARWSQDA